MPEPKPHWEDGLSDLEGEISDLSDMALILAGLLEEHMRDCQTGKRNGPIITVRLGEVEMRKLSFAWNEVNRRSGELRGKFYAKLEANSNA